jgi:hypothetical protein
MEKATWATIDLPTTEYFSVSYRKCFPPPWCVSFPNVVPPHTTSNLAGRYIIWSIYPFSPLMLRLVKILLGAAALVLIGTLIFFFTSYTKPQDDVIAPSDLNETACKVCGDTLGMFERHCNASFNIFPTLEGPFYGYNVYFCGPSPRGGCCCPSSRYVCPSTQTDPNTCMCKPLSTNTYENKVLGRWCLVLGCLTAILFFSGLWIWFDEWKRERGINTDANTLLS